LNKSLQWRAVDFASLKVVDWDGEFTVFQPAAGKTHFLNEMGLQILVLLDQSPATLEHLCQLLSEHFLSLKDKLFMQQIQQTLHRFEALGLIASINHSQ